MGTLDLGGKHGRHRGYSSLVLPSLPSPPFLSCAEDCGGIPAWLEYPPTRLRHARGGGWRGCRSSLEGPGGRRGEADHVVPPPGAAGLAGLAAREPGKPVSPSPGGPAGLTGPARLGRVGSRAPTRDLTSGRVPKCSAPAVCDSGNSLLPLSFPASLLPTCRRFCGACLETSFIWAS